MKTKEELRAMVCGLSAEECNQLGAMATARATDLRALEPSLELALASGVKDESYSTVRWGRITAYSGRAELLLENGTRWLAIGHGPSGTAEYVRRHGFVEFQPLVEETAHV